MGIIDLGLNGCRLVMKPACGPHRTRVQFAAGPLGFGSCPSVCERVSTVAALPLGGTGLIQSGERDGLARRLTYTR